MLLPSSLYAVLRRLSLALALCVFALTLPSRVHAQEPDVVGDAEDDATTEQAAGEDATVAPTPTEGEDAAVAPTPTEGEDAAVATTPTEGEDAGAATTPTEGEDAGAATTPTEGEDAGAAAPREGEDAGEATPTPAHGETPPAAGPKGEHEDSADLGEHEAPKGDVSFDELMPDEKEMAAERVDEDGDGTIDPEEEPIEFRVGAFDKDYVAHLKALIEKTREKIIGKMLYKTELKQAKLMDLLMVIMLGLTAAGLLILLVPIFQKKKYPGREKLLWKGAVLATIAWVSTMAIFTGAIFVMKTAKNVTSRAASPPLALANAAFDAASEKVEFLQEDAPIIIEAPIAKLGAGMEEDPLAAVLGNVAQFRNDLDVFMALRTFLKSLNWLFASLGAIFVVIFVVLFLLSQKQMLTDIMRLPGRAAAGDPGSFGAVYAEMQKRTWREVVALMATVVMLVVMAVISGVILYAAVGPAVKALFEYLIYNIYYILSPGEASKLVVYTSLFAVALFLGMVLLFVILANAFFLGKIQKVFQQKFRHQLPATTYKKFWLWGPISALWVQVLTVVFVVVTSMVVASLIELRRGFDGVSAGLLLTGPLVLLIGLPLFVWLGQGFRAMKFLRKFDHLTDSPEKKAPKAEAPAQAA